MRQITCQLGWIWVGLNPSPACPVAIPRWIMDVICVDSRLFNRRIAVVINNNRSSGVIVYTSPSLPDSEDGENNRFYALYSHWLHLSILSPING